MIFLCLLVFLAFLVVAMTIEKRVFMALKVHWFQQRSWMHKLSSLCIIIGIFVLSLCLLDPRGKPQNIKGKSLESKTIVLIDTSSSMLAEDVKPNRLAKAVLLAKHFIKESVGHQIAVMVFSDTVKKLVPFTEDKNLLAARVDAIGEIRNISAGSSISLSIKEALQYFKSSEEEEFGNIVVFTDGEAAQDSFDVELPKWSSIVFVGVGTEKGATIPIREAGGIFIGNKKNQGKDIISKLDVDYFKKMVGHSERIKYFLVQNYGLPTDEILSFLDSYKQSSELKDNVIRPVEITPFALVGLAFLMVGYLFRFMKPVRLIQLALVFCMSTILYAQEEKEISPELVEQIERLKRGELSKEEKINLGNKLVKEKLFKEGEVVLDEALKEDSIDEYPEVQFNRATAKLENKKIRESVELYKKLQRNLKEKPGKESQEILERIEENLKKAFSASSSSQSKQSEGEESQDQNNEGKGQSSDSKGSSKENNKNQDKENEKESKNNPFDLEKNKEKDKNKSQDNKDDLGDEKKEDLTQNKSQPEQKAGKKKKNLSPVFEQLKDNDRKIQMKLLDTSTDKRGRNGRKDW